MALKDRIRPWPKSAIGSRLQMFDGTVVLCRKREEWDAAVSYILSKPISQIDSKRLADPHNAGQCTYYHKMDGKGTMFLIGVFDAKSRTLLHELSHATFDICGYYGVPTNAGEANEFFCYLLEYLFSEFEPFLTKNATPTA